MSKITTKFSLPGGIKFECTGESNTVETERGAFFKLLEGIGYTLKTGCGCACSCGSDDAAMPAPDMPDGPCKVTLLSSTQTTLASLLSGIKDGSIKMHMGDSFTCTLSNGQRVTLVVTDEDEDSLRFEMKELLKCMPHTDVEEWYKELFAMFPAELQQAIIPTKRQYKEKGNGVLKEFEALLFMPSASEVFPAEDWRDWMGDKGVYDQMEFYKDAANRVRCTVEDGLTNGWWLLSALSGNSANFASVNYNGNAYDNSATNTWVAAPVCFRIRKF